jgi:hypothetical protein
MRVVYVSYTYRDATLAKMDVKFLGHVVLQV